MMAPLDLRGAFVWTNPNRLPPLMSDEAYQAWADDQHERWAVEAFADEMERQRRAQGRRDFFAVIFFLLCVGAVGVTLFVRSYP
jgi:hypothetical protein